MSLLGRTAEAFRTPRLEERSGRPSYATLEEMARVIGSGGKVTMSESETISGALAHAVVWRSVNKISSTVQMLDWEVRADGRKSDVALPAMLVAPSQMMLPGMWRKTVSMCILLGGGATFLVDDPFRPTQAELVHPDMVKWTQQTGWTIDNEPYDQWPLGPLVHIPYVTMPGSPKGLSPLTYARVTTYLGLAAKQTGAAFFRDGAHPTHVLSMKNDPGPEKAQEMKDKVRDASTVGSREPVVLPDWVDLKQLQLSPEDSQFIDTMSFTGGELAGFFGLMPEHVGLAISGGVSQQYSNRENRQQDYLSDAVMPVVNPIDEVMTYLLDRQTGGRKVRMRTADVLKPDYLTRLRGYLIAAQIKKNTGKTFIDPAEMRELENLPVFAGDE